VFNEELCTDGDSLFTNFNLTTQNYWASGLFPSPRILGNRGHDVSGTGSVSVFG
jgi:hypothetical protein